MHLKTHVQLLSELKNLCAQEVEIGTDILLYLDEVQRRKLDLRMGYSSLYVFCAKELGYAKDEAYLRIRAVEALRVSPQVELDLRAGKICPTALMQATVAFRRENKRRRRAKEDLLTNPEKAAVLTRIANESTRGVKKILAEIFPDSEEKPEQTNPLDKDLTWIGFSASEEELQDFARLKELLAHKNFDGSWRGLFRELAKIALKKLDPEPPKKRDFGAKRNSAETEVVSQPEQAPAAPDFGAQRNESPAAKPSPLRKHIPIHVQRTLLEKAAHRCEYTSPDGQRCESRHALQIDHIQPLAFGGRDERENLRVLCAQHNRYLAWEMGLSPQTSRELRSATMASATRIPSQAAEVMPPA